MPISMAICVLQVDMRQRLAGGDDEIINRRRAIALVGIMGMAGVNRQPQRSARNRQ
jgi:hypothetical protein